MEPLNSQFQIRPGTDIVYMPRFEDKIMNQRWIDKILTPNERMLFSKLKNSRRKLEFICGRFAAKEAYAKAVGIGIGPIDFQDIEILYDEKGRPVSPLMNVSISHDHEYAVAMVIVHEKV